MGKILIIGANGAVGKSCVQKLKENNDLVLVSRSKEEDNESSLNISSITLDINDYCLLYTSPSPRDATLSRMPSSA